MSDTVLSVKNLSISFKNNSDSKTVLINSNFKIKRGTTLSLVGESGSGKSITSLALVSLLPLNASIVGSINFNGEELIGLSEIELQKIRGNKISFIFQEPMTSLNPLHTIEKQIGESLSFHQNLSGIEKTQKVIELLEKVKIPNAHTRLKDYPHQLSGGQKQRVMIAIALANKPDLLIADEPTTSLDVTIEKEIIDLLMEIKSTEKMSIIFITHNLRIVKQISDYVCVMQNGKIIEQGSTQEIFETPKSNYTKKLLNSSPKGFRKNNSERISKILNVENLKVWFPIKRGFLRRTKGFIKAVDQISFDLMEEETLGIVGESGSGKTSLALAILKLINSEGSITFQNQNLQNLKSRNLLTFRKNAQIIFQDPYGSLSPKMNIEAIVGEGLDVHEKISKSKRTEMILQILNEVGLDEDMITRYPHEFSGGQRQRIAIARALILKPKLLILDEPTSALDVSVQSQVINLLKTIQNKYSLSYIFISHDIALIKSVSDKIIIMKDGIIVESGDTKNLFSKPKKNYTKELIVSSNLK